MRYLIILLLFTGCMSVEKAEKVMRAHPKELAELCLDCFGDKKEPEHVKGDTVVIVDSIVNTVSDTVTIVADCPDGTKVFVDCPPNKTITKYVHTHTTDTIYQDRWQTLAKLKILEVENEEYKQKYANEHELMKKWRKWCLVFGGILLSLGGVWFLIWYIGGRINLKKLW